MATTIICVAATHSINDNVFVESKKSVVHAEVMGSHDVISIRQHPIHQCHIASIINTVCIIVIRY